LYRRTYGIFNCLLGDVLVARGYGTGRAADASAARPVPTTDLSITKEAITLKNGSFDPGGFGKGYVIDELATLLKNAGVQHFLINGGGDIFGTSEPDGSPFTIHLEHPTEPDTYLGTTTLHHQGFAASSPFKRIWKQGDTTHTHIVGETDAATFVIAETARDADAFATACLLATPKQITTFADQNHLGVARYHPATSELTRINFPFLAL
jgi:thiamine biosynthesis lipoprotein